MLKRVTAKLGTMRKPQDFSVLTQTDGQTLVQSEKSIGVFDPTTGAGRLSIKGNTFIDLSMRGVRYDFPADFREACAAVLAGQGPTTDLGGVIMINTVTVIGDDLPVITGGASSRACLDAGLNCSIDDGKCTECGAPAEPLTYTNPPTFKGKVMWTPEAGWTNGNN